MTDPAIQTVKMKSRTRRTMKLPVKAATNLQTGLPERTANWLSLVIAAELAVICVSDTANVTLIYLVQSNGQMGDLQHRHLRFTQHVSHPICDYIFLHHASTLVNFKDDLRRFAPKRDVLRLTDLKPMTGPRTTVTDPGQFRLAVSDRFMHPAIRGSTDEKFHL